MRIRDELSGKAFDADGVRWSSMLNRSMRATQGQIETFGWRNRMHDNQSAWALAPGSASEWVPVEVLP